MTDDDSDETEGRALYRAQADALAKSQAAMEKRRFKLAEDKPNDDPGRPVPKHGSGPAQVHSKPKELRDGEALLLR